MEYSDIIIINNFKLTAAADPFDSLGASVFAKATPNKSLLRSFRHRPPGYDGQALRLRSGQAGQGGQAGQAGETGLAELLISYVSHIYGRATK